MVRHEAIVRLFPQGCGCAAACCACLAGESPVPASVGAPGSRPQAGKADLHAQAGCQTPAKRREPMSGKQARGPQHVVKAAAFTHSQPAGRTAHFPARAIPQARGPKRACGCGGVGKAARVQAASRAIPDRAQIPAGEVPAGPRNAASRRPLVSRVREIRMHGLNGGVGSVTGLRAI
jgi:hypothetical protein